MLPLQISYTKDLGRNSVGETATKQSSFPATQESSPGHSLNSKGEGTHPKTAIVSVAKVLNVGICSIHVFLQIGVHRLLFPWESLYILKAENFT